MSDHVCDSFPRSPAVVSCLIQELYSLMFSLDWVSIKAQIMGPAHLINDYVEYGSILDKEVCKPCSRIKV